MPRKALVAAVAAIAVPLSGCTFTFPAPSATDSHSQKDVIGPVEAITTICPNTGSFDFGPPFEAATRVASTCDTTDQERGQLFVAYLVPDGTSTADALSSSSGPALTWSRDDAYTSAVSTQVPPTSGSHWVGYRSSEYDVSAGTDPTTVVPADLGLPAGPQGQPFQRPFTYQTIVGQRFTSDVPGQDAGRPLSCPPSGIPFGDTACFAQTLGPFDVDTRDLGIVAPGTVFVQQGDSTTVPFSVQFAGAADPVATFALAAATTIPGGTAAADQPSFAPPTDSATTRNVSVSVPADAPLGIYEVTLTGSVAGQTRTGHAFVAVTNRQTPAPPPPAAPVFVPAGPPLAETLSRLPRHSHPSDFMDDGLRVRWGCNKACDATLDLLVYEPPAKRAGIARRRHFRAVPTVLIGRLNASRSEKGRTTSRIKLYPQAIEGLPHLNRYTLVVRTTAVDRLSGRRTRALVRKTRIRHGCATGAEPCVRH